MTRKPTYEELQQRVKELEEEILDHIHAKKKLREIEEELKAIFDSVREGLAVFDLTGKIVKINKRIVEVGGYSEEEIVGKRLAFLRMFPPKGIAKMLSNFGKLISGKETPPFEVEAYTKRGGKLNVELQGSPLRKRGRIEGMVGVMRDVTQRRRAEEEGKRLEARLQRAQKMEALGLLAGGVAHDLNNILLGIVSYPDLLLMDIPEDSPLRKPIETIKDSGQRAADVVSDLLAIARGVASSKMTVNLNDMVEEYLNSPEHKNLESMYPSVTFKTELEPHLLNVCCSPAHIKKSIMNLTTNAFEVIVGTGTVTVSTANRYLDEPLRGYEDVRQGEYAVLSVSDEGSGISPRDLERIFEPFYTKKVMGRSGTGLGLTVVWNTVQDHHGYININSSEKGTVFELYFPVTRNDVASDKGEVPPDDYLGHGEMILVVDDEKNQREIACAILTRLGYEAEAVSSGEEAVEYVKKHSVGLIVLDMVMPKGINGRETYEEIIRVHPGQKAIVASGFSRTEDVKIAQGLGAGKYVRKPYTLEKIGLAVKEELEK